MAKTLTKRDLVNKISAETNFTQIEVFDIVQRAVDIISSTLAEGDRVVIRNFGTFQVKEVKPKVGRNPKNPDQDVPIPARSVVKFKVGKELKDQVAKLTPPSNPRRDQTNYTGRLHSAMEAPFCLQFARQSGI